MVDYLKPEDATDPAYDFLIWQRICVCVSVVPEKTGLHSTHLQLSVLTLHAQLVLLVCLGWENVIECVVWCSGLSLAPLGHVV